MKVLLDCLDNFGEVELNASNKRVRITRKDNEVVWEWESSRELDGDRVAAKWNKKLKLLSLIIPFM